MELQLQSLVVGMAIASLATWQSVAAVVSAVAILSTLWLTRRTHSQLAATQGASPASDEHSEAEPPGSDAVARLTKRPGRSINVMGNSFESLAKTLESGAKVVEVSEAYQARRVPPLLAKPGQAARVT